MQQVSTGLAAPDVPLEEVVASFLRAGQANRSWARLMVWEALTGETGEEAEQAENAGQTGFLQQMVADLRRRQAAGELAADLDAAHVFLALFAAAGAPTVLPQIARSITGADPDSDDFLDAYAEQLTRITRHLRE